MLLPSLWWSYLVRSSRYADCCFNFLGEINGRPTHLRRINFCKSRCVRFWRTTCTFCDLKTPCLTGEAVSPAKTTAWVKLKLLQSCHLSVSTWDAGSWGGTGRCLELRLMEPSTTAEPQTGEACWTLVGQMPTLRLITFCLCLTPFFSFFLNWYLKKNNFIYIAPFKQRGNSKRFT